MSMLNTSGPAGEIGETVASVTEYEAAQKLVSRLIAGDIPARTIAIVGKGVQTVERVTGRLGYANAARSGAVNGVLIGLFLSAIFVLGNPAVPMQAFIGILFVGVAIGMILSLITYSIVRRRRDYASVMQLKADHYEVTVLAASVGKARQVLGAAVTANPAPASSASVEPPRYGERVEEPPRYGERLIPERPPMPPAAPAPTAAPAPAAEAEAPAEAPPSADSERPADDEHPTGDGPSR
ncbi:MAG: hypothetical protein JST25_06025 [Actinobacteria bacterium]|nr:hypothetical protein [Actinomycetota bacterium]